MASPRPSLQLTLEGYEAVAKAFNALPAKFQGQFLRPALRAGAKVMLKSVQLTAPKSTEAPHVSMTLKVRAMKRKTGRVGYNVITGKREALGIKRSTDSQRRAYNQRKRIERMMAKQGTSAGGLGMLQTIQDLKQYDGPGYYPAHLEYGYRRNGKHTPGTHWMRRGLEAGRVAAAAAVAQELSRRMKASIGLDKLSDAEVFGGPDIEVTV